MTSTLAVTDPRVHEVFQEESGTHHKASDVIGNDWGRAVQLRKAVKEAAIRGTPLYRCAACRAPVLLHAKQDKSALWFCHRIDPERNCPWANGKQISAEDINARKFHGLKEGRLHIDMKEYLRRSLDVDPDFSDVHIEKVWKSFDGKSWRKPDVTATFKNGLQVAFEAQLATTFHEVIVKRSMFYLNERALLVWVFDDFDASQMVMTQQDIFYNNNRNAFVVNQATVLESELQRSLVLRCHWPSKAYGEHGSSSIEANTCDARFGDLRVDKKLSRIYFADVEGDTFRHDFEAIWVGMESAKSEEKAKSWANLRTQSVPDGIQIPELPGLMPHQLLDALYSAKVGRPVGTAHETLLQFAHHVYDKQREHFWAFVRVLKFYGRLEQLARDDKKGNWRHKLQLLKQGLSKGNPKFGPNLEHKALIRLLFPEISKRSNKLEAWQEQQR
jgi:hypothetical protein